MTCRATERTASPPRGRLSAAAAAQGADAAERPEKRTNRSDRRGFFSQGSESTGAGLGRIKRSGQRPGRGGDGASWPRARFSGGAGERPRGRTMGRRGKLRGFSRRAGLGFSGTTATARVFGTEAAALRRGLCPSVPRLSVPHRTNRVAPCGAAIAVDGKKTPPPPAFSHPLPRRARELETRPFSRGKVKVPGHSKVFPIGMCYIWEVEGDDNFEVFKEVPNLLPH